MARGRARHLLDAIDAIAGRRIVVLGDLVADEFIYADIARISREAPVLILRHRRTISVPGGGGNSAANLAALGARVIPVGVVGRDPAGGAVLAALRELGCSASGIVQLAGYETPSKSRMLAGGIHTRRQQIVRLDSGAESGELAAAVRKRLRAALARAIRGADGLLVADYGYGSASPSVLRGQLRPLLRGGTPVTVDSRYRLGAYPCVTACTPNQEEVERVLELEGIEGPRALERAGRRLLQTTGNGAVLVTLGAQGMWLFRKGRPTLRIAPYGSDEVADVTGAGDTVIATLTLALASGAPMEVAARLANYAAGLVVQKAGTATVAADELREAVLEDTET
jgi:rfaE bifunctional protein kinase chain/domain